MKKFLSVLFALSLILGLCSCKNEVENDRFLEGSIVITHENMPKISVTEVNQKIAENLVSAVLGCSTLEAENYLTVYKTPYECYESLANGESDIVIAHEPSQKVKELFEKRQISLQSSTIANDALIFMVSSQIDISNLNIEQLKGIYGGTITDWNEVSSEKGTIVPFLQNDNLASTDAFNRHLDVDVSSLSVPVKTINTKDGTFVTKLPFDNDRFSIGYALYQDTSSVSAEKNGEYKILSVDGVCPDSATIQSGQYKLSTDILVSVNADTSSLATKLFYDWILSEQGVHIISGSGAILDVK